MIVDNADNEAAFFEIGSQLSGPSADGIKKKLLDYYIPRCIHGSVLVTTRDKAVAVNFTKQYKNRRIEVVAMSMSESRELLRMIISDEMPLPDLDKLIELLDNLPLALVQAGAYIERNLLTAKEYLKIYYESEESAVMLLDKKFESDGRDEQIPNAVATSWMISFEQIRVDLPRAAEVLSLMAFFDRQAIPESLLKNQDESFSSFKESIGKLLAYSLVTRNVKTTHIDEHRLAHLISRAWLRQKGDDDKWLAAAQERILERFPKEDYKNWDICGLYIPHARAVIDRQLKNHLGTYSQSTNWLLIRIGNFLHFQGSYASSMEIYKQLLDYCLKHRGPGHPDTLRSVNGLAVALEKQGQYEAAEKLYRQALAGREKVLGLEHPDTLRSVNSLAVVLEKRGQYEAAEKLYRQALAGMEKALGPEHPDTLCSVNNLAKALRSQGKSLEIQMVTHE
jgi:tetratricopeptide (TPR) repeat protein